jgi:hypothetical protein
MSPSNRLKIKDLADKYGLKEEEVEKIVEAPYKFIRKKLKDLDFSEYKTKEEFSAMKTNFNIPAIGKFYASYNLHNRININKNKKKLAQ